MSIRINRLVPLLTLGAALVLGSLPVAAADGPAESLALVDAMIEAHGGLEAWASAPTVSFTDEFRHGEATGGQPSRVTVEQGRRRAYIDFPGTDMRMSWDGEKAWSENWQAPMPPRFLALLNYYFVNLPWMARDPGVHLSEVGTATIPNDPVEYATVKMTFADDAGDTPDDYYILYIDPATHRLRATEYIVTYRSILPEGMAATPPHLLVFDEMTTVGGLVVPTHFTIHEGPAVYATCQISDWSFEEPFDTSRMEMPEGAAVDTSSP